MARKISDRERLITFVLGATTDQLQMAKELIDTALRQKSPKRTVTNRKNTKGPNKASDNPPHAAD